MNCDCTFTPAKQEINVEFLPGIKSLVYKVTMQSLFKK